MINKLLQFSEREHLISEDDIDVYKYGYSIVIETVINVLVALIIALVLDEIKLLVLFSILFIPLRIYAGGVHANSSHVCTIISNVVLIITYIVVDYLKVGNVEKYVMIFMTIVFGMIVLVLSPVDCKEKKIVKDDVKKFKTIVFIIVLNEIVLQIYMTSIDMYVVMIVFFVEMVSLCIGKIKNKLKNFLW